MPNQPYIYNDERYVMHRSGVLVPRVFLERMHYDRILSYAEELRCDLLAVNIMMPDRSFGGKPQRVEWLYGY